MAGENILLSIPKEKIKRLVIYLVSIIIVNITLAIIDEPTGTTTDLRGHVVSSPASIKQAVIVMLLIGNTALGFVLGTIVSLLPYRNLPYQKKYLSASLICILTLQIFYLILELKYLIGSWLKTTIS